MAAVLIVEDDPGIADVLRFLAEANHMQAFVANTFEIAIREAAAHPPDIAIVDLGLPDRDGIQLVRELRSQSQLAIIVLSARTQGSQRRAAILAGADDYVTKPFSAPELFAKMQALLGNGAPG